MVVLWKCFIRRSPVQEDHFEWPQECSSYTGLTVLANSSPCIGLIFINQSNLVVDCGVHPSLHANFHHQSSIHYGGIETFVPRVLAHFGLGDAELFLAQKIRQVRLTKFTKIFKLYQVFMYNFLYLNCSNIYIYIYI